MYRNPDKDGHFGEYGGIYIPEILMGEIYKLIDAYNDAKKDTDFQKLFESLSKEYSCRPTPLTYAHNLTDYFGGAKIYIKREDLNHTGSHKFNNVLGQGLLAKRMGKTRIIAETGAGQHGVATATICAKLGLSCTIYMGAKDIERQYPNVFWMKQLGAEVVAIETGGRTLKDAINACLQDWISNPENTHYLLGTVAGPHPFPTMVRDFQSIIGKEVKKQIMKRENRLPHAIIACVGGGSNAMGIFYPFIDDKDVKLIGVEAGGKGIQSKQHAARFSTKEGRKGVVQGYKSYFMQNSDGQIIDTHSISAGLDYAGVGPEHAFLKDIKRVEYTYALDKEVIKAIKLCMEKEGIIPALESAHAFAHAFKIAKKYTKEKILIVNQSGRGDKDIFTIANALEDNEWKDFIKKQK